MTKLTSKILKEKIIDKLCKIGRDGVCYGSRKFQIDYYMRTTPPEFRQYSEPTPRQVYNLARLGENFSYEDLMDFCLDFLNEDHPLVKKAIKILRSKK